ncbi:PGF-pre-PGF domain-containing protein [Candidatus Woesearchaeota archaeon]|nr:PGF-pre-PGF domain-containing protein [Candidatus Woesearchaeota archaeon]
MKNKMFTFLVILLITAVLAVPILAKQARDQQYTQYNDSAKGKAKQLGTSAQLSATEFNVSSGSSVFKEVRIVSSKNSEKLRHNIKMGGLLATGTETAAAEGAGSVKMEKSNGKMQLRVPYGLEVKEQARIKLKDLSGEEVAEIIADIDLSDSEENRIEKGQASLRSIKSLRLVSKEKQVEVADSEGNRHRIKANVDVSLNYMNEDSSLEITTNNDLEEDVAAKFDELAKKNRLRISNRGGVMKVDKAGLKNGAEVAEARVTFKVEPEWVGEGNINNIRILRYDEGYTEILPTEFTGVDDEGLLVFEGESGNGLSTFAVVMADNISNVEDTTFDFKAMKGFLLPLLIIVTVGAAFVGSMMRKEHK